MLNEDAQPLENMSSFQAALSHAVEYAVHNLVREDPHRNPSATYHGLMMTMISNRPLNDYAL